MIPHHVITFWHRGATTPPPPRGPATPTGWTTVTCRCGWSTEQGSDVEAGWAAIDHRRREGLL